MTAIDTKPNDQVPVTFAQGKLTEAGLSILRDKVTKLNNRARRLHLRPITVTVTGESETTVEDKDTGIKRTIKWHHVDVQGVVPKLDGWQVIARIDFSEVDGQNFVSAAPGIGDLDPKYRTMQNRCDHCNKKRNRKDLIVVRHDDGRELVLGHACLKDYVRSGDVEQMMLACGWVTELPALVSEQERDYYGGGRQPRNESLQTILEATSICVRKLGWKSSQAENSTKCDVVQLLYGGEWGAEAARERQKWIAKNELYITDHDRIEAVLAMQWMQSLRPSNYNDFIYNMSLLSQCSVVPDNKLGLAVAAIVSAQKSREQELNRKKAAEKQPREYIGEVGERLKGLIVECTRVRSIENEWGVSTLVVFQEARGQLTWFATGDQTECWTAGEKYKIDATVKSHRDHEQYGKSTAVNRVKGDVYIERSEPATK